MFAAIDSLVAKSMLTVFPAGAMMRYRLLETARAYALDIAADRAERAALAARHAHDCLRWLEPFAAEGPPLSDRAARAPLLFGLNNIRAALEWSLGTDGDARLGARLAAAAKPAFQALSLLTECYRWSRRALLVLDAEVRGGAEELLLREGLGLSSMLTRGHGNDLQGARAAFEAARRQPEMFVQGFDYRVIAGGYLARILWLQGYPAQAAEALRANVTDAARAGHPVSQTFALTFALPLMLWLGDVDGAAEYLAWLVAHTETHSQPLALAVARGFQGQLAIARRDAQAGVDRLHDSLRDLDAANYNIWKTPFNLSRGRGLLATGPACRGIGADRRHDPADAGQWGSNLPARVISGEGRHSRVGRARRRRGSAMP